MKKSKNTPTNENREMTALELVEKVLIACILDHTNSLGEAEEYAPVKAAAFLAKRIKYGLRTPPRNSYGGPKLTQQQMVDVFVASLVAQAQAAQPVAPSPNITFAPPTGAPGNVPPSAPSTPV